MVNFNKLILIKIETVHLNTVRLPTATHSDRCLDAFHCSSAVSGLWSIDVCPVDLCSNRGYPIRLKIENESQFHYLVTSGRENLDKTNKINQLDN